MATEDEKGSKHPKDIRHYCCKTCGITRSKRILLKCHIISSHGQEALENDERFVSEAEGKSQRSSPCVCEECGVSFNKPAHLEQHKLSHTGQVVFEFFLCRRFVTQRTFVCPVDGCSCSYKRQDHLNRHLVKHEGKLFVCPKEDCKLQLSSMSNLKRHLKRHGERGESWQSINLKPREVKKYPCPKPCCGKVFQSPSRLLKHLDDVHSTTYVEIVCCEPGCLKYFTNAEALREHVQQNHSRVCCEVCGSQQLKKQIKRHMRIHLSQTSVERIQCHFDNCLHSFTRKSNLNQHIRAVHLGLRPYKCGFRGCEMNFAHKAVRDNHEKTGRHCFVEGDFFEEDAAFQSRPRGGRKRKAFTMNSLLKKRVACPNRSSTVLDNGSSFLDWLTSSGTE